MRFLVDECLSRHVVDQLRNAGHDVVWAQHFCPAADDRTVLKLATESGRLVISEDWDFGVLVVRLGLEAIGIIILPTQAFDKSLDELAAYATGIINKLGSSCEGSLTVIEPHKIRQRPINRIIPSQEDLNGS